MEDRHVHSYFCPHGSKDSFEQYIENALQRNITHISFTEHAPLPANFIDPTPDKDSGMDLNKVELYIEAIQKIKKQYKNELSISCGFEVDYIEGYEKETQQFLDTYGKYIEDSILSVHFLKTPLNTYECLDFSADVFKKMTEQFGHLENITNKYIDTLHMSVDADLGTYKPKRLGHITLIKKFQHAFPFSFPVEEKYISLLNKIKDGNYSLDFNSAGLRKELCKEVYPSLPIVKKAIEMEIPLIFGSDAHIAEDIGADFTILKEMITNVSNNKI